MKKPNQNVNVEIVELNAEELAGVEGGAGAFLRGAVTSGQSAQVNLPSLGSVGSYATSGTTLCKWHECTRYISSC